MSNNFKDILKKAYKTEKWKVFNCFNRNNICCQECCSVGSMLGAMCKKKRRRKRRKKLMSLISDFCRESCPFAFKNDSDCPCLDEKIKCPVDYYSK